MHRRRIARSGRRFRPGMGGRVGDDARQVRGAAVRRRTHPARGTGGVGQHVGALAAGLAGRQHRYRRRDGCAGFRRRVTRSWWDPAAPRPPRSSGWPSLACNGSRSSPAIPTRPRHWWTSATGSGVEAGWCSIDSPELARVVADVGRGGQHDPGRRGGAVRAGVGARRRCCSTRSTTRGRRRWPRRSRRPAAG